jgi:hypothetical protein
LCSVENISFIYNIYFVAMSAAPSTLLPVVTVPLLPSAYASAPANPQLFVLMKVRNSSFSGCKMQEISKDVGRQMLFRVKVHMP